MEKLIQTAYSYYNQALDAMATNDVTGAVALLDKSLNIYSKNADALNLMGLCQYMFCNFDKAGFYWSKTLTIDETNEQARKYLQSLNSEEFVAVIERYNQAIDCFEQKKYKHCINLMETIVNEENKLIEPYIIISYCFYLIKNIDQAKKYINQTLAIDKNNVEYLAYLSELNACSCPEKKKTNLVYLIVSCVLVLAAISLTTLYCLQSAEYSRLYVQSNMYADKIQEQQNKIAILEQSNQDREYDSEDLLQEYIGESENTIFNRAFTAFKNENYPEAFNGFYYVAERGVEEHLVAEAVYFSAVCKEKEGAVKEAEKYYAEYIDRFVGRNYYDDALYQYGLLLYQQGDAAKAKSVLQQLQDDVPNSIFVNSKVRYVLNN